jgi:uncharacterized protein YndB with AHSA1/START domain
MPTHSVKPHRVLRAKPDRIYRAFIDADAMAQWLPPCGFTGKVQHMDARVGGSFRMPLTNFDKGLAHSFGGEYLELNPGELIRDADRFDDANLPREMQVTVSLRPLSCGTDVNNPREGFPAVIPVEMCCLGCQQSLAQLATLVESGIAG